MPNRTKDDLWERQPGESAQAYEAFAIYRDMGSNRSLRVVAEQLSKSDTLIKRWSREKKWGERCRAYDNHFDDVARQEALRKYKKMRTRHIGIALQLQEKALAELKNLPDGSMTPKDIMKKLCHIVTEITGRCLVLSAQTCRKVMTSVRLHSCFLWQTASLG